MPRRYAAIFAAIGYLLAIWIYSDTFNLLHWQFGRDLLWNTCVGCVSIIGFHSARLATALLIFGPINALAYASAGFLLWKFAHYVRGHGKRVSS